MNSKPTARQTENTHALGKKALILRAKHLIKNYFAKMCGTELYKRKREYFNLRELFTLVLTIFGSIGVIAWISFYFNLPLLIPSFLASAVLLYTNHQSSVAQPRNIIGGHVLSATIGVLTQSVLGANWYSLTIALVIAIILMMLTGTIHPPAGGTLYIAIFGGFGLKFVLITVAAGSLLMVVISMLLINIMPWRKYPSYWW
ncbi:HPP family protein [Desulfotruncus alcoholivorax]|uniref:HPP family protein n=1 Tax=Desulfotruncus alcoholivorax TaxID=265477 RepID=UPI000685D863|nr:HPP family protein [Desulfotruncus alcoholivorax]